MRKVNGEVMNKKNILFHYKQCTHPRALTTSASPSAPKVKRPSVPRTRTSLVFLYIKAANSACKDQKDPKKKAHWSSSSQTIKLKPNKNIKVKATYKLKYL